MTSIRRSWVLQATLAAMAGTIAIPAAVVLDQLLLEWKVPYPIVTGVVWGGLLPGYAVGNLLTIGRLSGPHFVISFYPLCAIWILANSLCFYGAWRMLRRAGRHARLGKAAVLLLWLSLVVAMALIKE